MSSIPSQYPNRNELADQYSTQKAERDELERTHQDEMDNLKKSYATEKANLEDRFEQSTQHDKLSHYDHLRNQKHELEREEKRLEDDRRSIIGNKESEVRTTLTQTEADGKSKIQSLEQKMAAAAEYERRRGLEAEEMVRTQHKHSAESIINQSNKDLHGLQEEKASLLANAKDAHAQALNEMQEHYLQARTQVSDQYQSEWKNNQTIAAADLNDRKLTNAIWIQQYADRLNDPFYRMNRFQSSLTENEESYSLKVKVPEYERNQFRVQVAGKDVQLTGIRTNNEKAEVEPGRWISSATNQNVSERYSLDHPVDPKLITMTVHGDWLHYDLPKYGSSSRALKEATDLRHAQREEASLKKEIDFPNSLPKPALPRDRSGKGTINS